MANLNLRNKWTTKIRFPAADRFIFMAKHSGAKPFFTGRNACYANPLFLVWAVFKPISADLEKGSCLFLADV